MILKIRFAPGRTQYIDLGNEFLFYEQQSEEYPGLLKDMGINPESEKDCIGVVSGKDSTPIYNCFVTEIFSNDGQLFMVLHTGSLFKNMDDTIANRPNIKELQDLLQKMNYYHKENGFMAVTGGVYTFFEDKPNSIESVPITKEWLLKLAREA